MEPLLFNRSRVRLHVFDPDDPRFFHGATGFAHKPAGADRPVGDGAPQFASQRGMALALVDRLDRDCVTHTPHDDTPEAA